MKKRGRFRRFAAACLRYCVLPAALAAAVALLYARQIGLPEPVAEKLLRAIPIETIAVTAGRIRFCVFEGLTAENVRVFKRGDIGPALMKAEKITLELNPLDRVLGRGTGLKSVSIHAASLEEPSAAQFRGIEETAGARLLGPVNALITFEPGNTVSISNLTSALLGVPLSGKGRIVLAKQPAPWTLPWQTLRQRPAPGPQPDAIQRLLENISPSNIALTGIETEFFIDLGDPGRSNLRFHLAGGKISADWGGIGAWDAELNFTADAIDAEARLKDAVFRGAEAARASCRLKYEPLKPVQVEELAVAFSSAASGGNAVASGVFDAETLTFKGEFRTTFDPHVLLPVLDYYRLPQSRVVRDFEFAAEPPEFSAKFTAKAGANGFFLMSGRAAARDLVFRGAEADRVTTDLTLTVEGESCTLNLSPMEVYRPEGWVRGALFFDFKEQALHFQVQSDVSPQAAARWIGPFMTRLVSRFRTDHRTVITTSGKAGFSNQALNDIEILIDSEKIGFWKLDLENCSALIRMLEDNVIVESAAGEFYGGTLRGSGEARPSAQDANLLYYFQADVENADATALAAAFGVANAEKYSGACAANLQIEGATGDAWLDSLAGQGRISVSKGRVFQIPLFGPLSNILGRLIPGVDWLMRQSDAKADFNLGDRLIYSEQARVEGDVFALEARGGCGFDGALDFLVQLKFLRQHTFAAEVLRTVLWPLSKILEMQLGGTVAEPRWSARGLELYGIFE